MNDLNCIYNIVNLVNGRKYVGRTNSPKKREYRHFLELSKNIHHCLFLQRSFNKHGVENFKFVIIESDLTDEQAIEREQYYLDNEKNLYNVSNNAHFGGDLLTNNPNREKIIAKMTDAMRKRYANMSGEDRKRLSEKLTGENNPNFGNRGSKNPLFKVKKTDTHKLNISKALKGREFSDQHKINISKSKLNKEPWNKGLKTGSLSDQHKENLSKSLKGISNDHKKNAIICENIYFESIIQASKYFEVSSTAILQRINSETSRWESYKYFDEKIHNINNYTAYNESLKKPNNTGDQRSRKISCEGIVFNSLKEAREHFGVNSSSTIKNRIDSKLDRWKDYFYINQ